MKTTLVLCALFSPLALFPRVRAVFQDSKEPKALERVAPIPAEEEESDNPLERVFRKDFDREEWIERLTETDLEARERTYIDLVRRAKIDPLARAFLEELAQDSARPELAWTARLALREIGRPTFSFPGVLPDDLGGFGLDGRMEEMLRQLWQEHPSFPFSPPQRPRLRLQVPPSPSPPGSGSSERSVQVQETPEGAKIVITETVDGKESTREFEGQSLEEILEQNPELSEELHFSVIPDGFRLHWQHQDRWQGLLAPFEYGDEGRRLPEAFFERHGLFDRSELDRFFAPTEKSRAFRTDVLGVVIDSAISKDRAAELGAQSGLIVQSVSPGTIAALLGIRSGDVLLEVNGKPLARAQDITNELETRAEDGSLTVVWIDDLGQRNTKTWTPESAAK